MTKITELSGDKRSLSYTWESIPSDSPLANRYAQMLIAILVEEASPSTNLECQIPLCDKKAWMVVRENPLQLKDYSGRTVEISSLDPIISEQILQARKKVAAICKPHLLGRYADSLKKT